MKKTVTLTATPLSPIELENQRWITEQTLQSIRTLSELLWTEQDYRTGTFRNRVGLDEKEQAEVKTKLVFLVNKL